jgi:uncharacterized membrane protein
MYHWLVFLHVIGIFGFLVSHGASASIFFALRRERNIDRVRLLLQLSVSSFRFLGISFLVLLLSGVIAGFVGQWWGYGWIWLSLLLLIAIYIGMSLLGTRVLNTIRQGIGLPSTYGQPPRPELMSAEMLDMLLSQSQPTRLALLGFGGISLIAWLMMFKPF